MDSCIIVPTDFSKVAAIALDHANTIANSAHTNIILLHVIPDNNGFREAKRKLEELAVANENRSGVKTIAEVRIGSIFDQIGQSSNENNARLVVMGTHGAVGMQRLIGSYALKVIAHSSIPFIVVQNDTQLKLTYNDIVLPINFNKKTKQKLKYAVELAGYFKAKVHIFIKQEEDIQVMNFIKRNLVFAREFLSGHGIEYETHVSTSKNDFDDELLDYSKSINSDLICIMNDAEEGIINNLLGSHVQNLMVNKFQIPVMVVNPKDFGLIGHSSGNF